MNRIKCNRCGLINGASDERCRRCEINLHSSENVPPPRSSAVSDLSDLNDSSSMKVLIIILVLVIASAGAYKLFYVPYAEEAERERIGAQKTRETQEKIRRESEAEQREQMKKVRDDIRDNMRR